MLLEVPVGKSSKETKELQVACPVVCVADDKDWHRRVGRAEAADFVLEKIWGFPEIGVPPNHQF